MLDVAMFEALNVFPARCLVWRSASERMTHRRNPLYAQRIGITPTETSALDWLHTLSLGVFQTWCSFAIHCMIEADAWGTHESTIGARTQLSVERLSLEAVRWVRREIASGRTLTELGDLTHEVFGTPSKPKFGLKAGETNTILEYLVKDLVPRSMVALAARSQPIRDAGRHLLNLLELIRARPKTFPAAAIQSLHGSAKAYLVFLGSMDIVPKPKDHMLMEMSLRIPVMGSPALYGCWQDEGLNRLLRDVAKDAHSRVHDKRILSEFPRAHDRARAKKKPRTL